MNSLLQYLNSLSPPEQELFASRCGTTVGYLRKAISKQQKLGEGLCINIERESGGQVRCEQLRPSGVDWAYLRGSSGPAPAVLNRGEGAEIVTPTYCGPDRRRGVSVTAPAHPPSQHPAQHAAPAGQGA